MEKTSLNEVKSKKKGGEIMKKTLMLIALVVLFAAPAMALNIKTSKHNMGSTNAEGTYGKASSAGETNQVCIFCHTPHNPAQQIPLWNRSNPSGSFALYTASPSINISASDKNGISSDSVSLFCLSCHDGATGALGGRVVQRGSAAIDSSDAVNMRTYAAIGSATGSSSLTNDHPVNFGYDVVAGIDNNIRSRTSMSPAGTTANYEGGSLRFFKSAKGSTGAYLECATCHDPHGKSNPASPTNRIAKFLRKSNDSSSLCLTCHIK